MTEIDINLKIKDVLTTALAAHKVGVSWERRRKEADTDKAYIVYRKIATENYNALDDTIFKSGTYEIRLYRREDMSNKADGVAKIFAIRDAAINALKAASFMVQSDFEELGDVDGTGFLLDLAEVTYGS